MKKIMGILFAFTICFCVPSFAHDGPDNPSAKHELSKNAEYGNQAITVDVPALNVFTIETADCGSCKVCAPESHCFGDGIHVNVLVYEYRSTYGEPGCVDYSRRKPTLIVFPMEPEPPNCIS